MFLKDSKAFNFIVIRYQKPCDKIQNLPYEIYIIFLVLF